MIIPTFTKYPKVKIRTRTQKALRELKETWSEESDRKRDFKLISMMFRSKKKSDEAEIIDDSTWADLNMDCIFSKIDRTITPAGAQYLYNIMRIYERDPSKLKERFKIFRKFQDNADFRENIQLKLLKLSDRNYYYIPDLIYSDLPEKPRGYKLIYFFSFLLAAIIFSTIIYKPILLASIPICIMNIIIKRFFEKRVFQYFDILANLRKLLKIAVRLSKIDNSLKIPELEIIRKNRPVCNRLIQKLGFIMPEDDQAADPFFQMLLGYLQTFFLVHLISFCRSHEELKKNMESIIDVFESIGAIDASISVASYLEELPYYSNPVFNNEKIIDTGEINHPLLENPVANDFRIENSSVLVTGSNMAGKTTFIRTIAVNTILAQTLFFCLSKSANIPLLTVKSLIRREDDITEGKSYFFREVESILEIINFSRKGSGYLFLIDEIFRGTNTVERISSATAVLKELCRKNIAMVTTHDLELQDLLEGQFVMHHFSEQVDGERYYFDYKIKAGPCSSRNAIKLLELKGYPEEIVKNALDLSKKFVE